MVYNPTTNGHLVSVTDTSGNTVALSYLFVAPGYRRWGIGTQLIEECIELARGSEMTSIVAEIDAKNPAVAVYLKAGFRVCGFVSAPAAQNEETVLIVACSL